MTSWISLLLLAFATLAHASSVRTVELEVAGSGATHNDAVNDALIEAIAQKSGRTIATQTDLKSVLSSVSTSETTDAVAAETLARRIQTATQGSVLGYKVLQEGKDERGLVTVKLQVQMGEFIKSAQADRIRIAVSKVRVAALDSAVGEQVEAAAKSALTDTRKFAVLDRDWEKEYAAEMSLLTSGTAARVEGARLGQRLGTDLLIVSTVSQVRVSPPSEDGALLDVVASASCNFSLIDAATGLIKVSKTFPKKLNRLQARQTGAAPDQIATALARAIGKQIAELVLEASYPLVVVSTADQELVVNQGGDRLKAGQEYEIFSLGETLSDPQTGERLGQVEKLAGRATLTRVTAKLSYARIDKATTDIAPGMILRAASAPEVPAKPALNKNDRDW